MVKAIATTRPTTLSSCQLGPTTSVHNRNASSLSSVLAPPSLELSLAGTRSSGLRGLSSSLSNAPLSASATGPAVRHPMPPTASSQGSSISQDSAMARERRLELLTLLRLPSSALDVLGEASAQLARTDTGPSRLRRTSAAAPGSRLARTLAMARDAAFADG
eukprot:365747-Chlamydomonas_euryale.AAC.16